MSGAASPGRAATGHRILALGSPGEVRVVLLASGVLTDYALWRPGAPDLVGDLHRGRVIAAVPAMAGAFVSLAGGIEGFLPDTAGAAGLGAGAAVLVRVVRAALGGKGPRLAGVTAAAVGAPIAHPLIAGPPGLLRRGPSALARFAAAWPEADIHTDDPALLAALHPTLGARMVLDPDCLDPELEAEIAALAETTAPLPGGAYLHIHPTPALTAIDLDAGAATAVREGKRTAQAALNRAAIPELARQIRLRNLGGAILVDPAGLAVRRRAALGPALAAALAADPLAPRLLGFTALGLVEILRPVVHPPLHELLAGPHAAGLAALRAIAREVAANPAARPRLRAAPAIVAALQADPVALDALAARTGQALRLEAVPALGGWELASPTGPGHG